MNIKEKIIELLIECDEYVANVISNEDTSPSCSIQEIAEYLAPYLKEDINCESNYC